MHHAHITFRMIGMEYPVNNKQNIRKPKNVIKIKIKSAHNPSIPIEFRLQIIAVKLAENMKHRIKRNSTRNYPFSLLFRKYKFNLTSNLVTDFVTESHVPGM